MSIPHLLRRTSAATVLALATMLPAQAETLVYATGFEAPGFSTGPIGGGYYDLPQWTHANGWSAWPNQPYSAAPSPWAVVSDLRAASGTQSLRMSVDDSSNSQIIVGRTIPAPGLPLGNFGVAMNLYIEQTADSDVTWSMGLSDGYATLIGMSFLPDDRVQFGHRLMHTSSLYTPGFDLHNTWLTLRMESNPADNSSVLLTVAGRGQTWQQVVTSPGGAATSFYTSGAYPSFPLYKDGVAYMDNLRIGSDLAPSVPVPEPQTWALMLLGLGALARSARQRAGR